MPQVKEYFAATHLFNNSVKTPLGLKVGDGGSISKVGTELFGVLTEKRTPLNGYISQSHKVFIRQVEDPENTVLFENQELAFGFALNAVAGLAPLLLGETYVFSSARVKKFVRAIPPSVIPHSNFQREFKYEVLKGAKSSQITDLYAKTLKALEKDKSIKVSIGRLLGSVVRNSVDDTYIDIAVALESLIEARTEISRQFAVLNAIICEDNLEERHDIFKLLQNFYNTRSSIVHGTSTKIKYLDDKKMDKIFAITKKAILYKILKAADGCVNKDWKIHQEKLMLGQEKPNW